MRSFAHLPSNRRIAGVIAFALMAVIALGAVHHHRLAVVSDQTAFAAPVASENGRTADCFVCRTVVSARELVPRVSAPHVVVDHSIEAPSAAPALADAFRPSVPRGPPAA